MGSHKVDALGTTWRRVGNSKFYIDHEEVSGSKK